MISTLCYLVLCFITAYVIVISISIIKKTSSLILVAPVAVIYFWTIYGAWAWIPMKASGGYHFYEGIMFVVDIDSYYLASLILYSIFIIVFITYLFYIANIKSTKKSNGYDIDREFYRETIDVLDRNNYYYSILYLLFLVFVFFSVKDLKESIIQGVSAYELSRFDSTIGSIGTLVIFSGDTFLYLSVPLLFVRKSLFKKFKVILPIFIYFIVNLLLGNRNTLLCGMLEGVILSVELYGFRKIIRPRNVIIAVLAFMGIVMVSVLRGLAIEDILSGDFEIDFLTLFDSANKSDEKYAAHISMYGVLKNNVPFTYGSSIISLLSTAIPSFIGIKRPDDIYMYYVMQTAHSKPDIGMTLHYATGWYLNFGFLGIVLGALVWGYVIKRLYFMKYKFIYMIGSVLFSAVSIQMIRGGGLEAYKGVLLMDTIIPMIIVYYCLKKNRLYKGYCDQI